LVYQWASGALEFGKPLHQSRYHLCEIFQAGFNIQNQCLRPKRRPRMRHSIGEKGSLPSAQRGCSIPQWSEKETLHKASPAVAVIIPHCL